MNDLYDVAIIGGGTAGCSCAWNCARLGLRTILLEKESYLGGTIVGALVIPVMKVGDNLINTEFYNELINNMKSQNAQITYLDNPGWFNPEKLSSTLDMMLLNVGVTIVHNFDITNLNYKNFSIEGHKINSMYIKKFKKTIRAKYFVDASGNLYLSKILNCQFLKNTTTYQPVSLRFIMNWINLEEFGAWLLDIDNDRDVTTVEKINGHTHLSTAYTWDTNKQWALSPYFEEALKNGELNDTDRNYFQVFTIAGMPDGLAFNCPRILENINPYSAEDLKKAYIIGKSSIKRIAKFCKKYFPGFEKAKIYKIADKIGIRSADRIRGKYVYTIQDLRSRKKFNNPVLISNYPVDVHNTKKGESTLEKNGEYQLPIESLMSSDYDNLFIIGRGISSDELSQGALRVQSNCFSMGEGLAKYLNRKES